MTINGIIKGAIMVMTIKIPRLNELSRPTNLQSAGDPISGGAAAQITARRIIFLSSSRPYPAKKIIPGEIKSSHMAINAIRKGRFKITTIRRQLHCNIVMKSMSHIKILRNGLKIGGRTGMKSPTSIPINNRAVA
tara:strand:+ start:135 stop:539 length:405 start_codon:yes stop_codon:yes gene_type:complete